MKKQTKQKSVGLRQKKSVKAVKAWALVSKETGEICRIAMHILKSDCPFCIYESKDFLEGDDKTKKVEVLITPIIKKK